MSSIALERVRAVKAYYNLRQYITRDLGAEPSGGNYEQVICPFHEDKKPSLVVYETNFVCYACGVRGDIVDYVQLRTDKNWYSAIEVLEQGTALPGAAPPMFPYKRESEKPSVGRDRLLETIWRVMGRCQRQFEGSRAQEYADNRGWSRDVQRWFGFGYAPMEVDDFWDDDEAAEELGLVNKDGWPWISGKLVFTIRNTDAVPVAIGTRTLRDNGGPRYINSRRTSVFHKDETLYGLANLPSQHLANDTLFVVEGYADVWSLATWGLNGVAVMGSNMTQAQGVTVLHTAQERGAAIVLAFDGDEAGQAGEESAWNRLYGWGIPLFRLELDGDSDIDDILQSASVVDKPAHRLEAGDGTMPPLQPFYVKTPLHDYIDDFNDWVERCQEQSVAST